MIILPRVRRLEHCNPHPSVAVLLSLARVAGRLVPRKIPAFQPHTAPVQENHPRFLLSIKKKITKIFRLEPAVLDFWISGILDVFVFFLFFQKIHVFSVSKKKEKKKKKKTKNDQN